MSDETFDEWVETISEEEWDKAIEYLKAHDPFPFFEAYQLGLNAAKSGDACPACEGVGNMSVHGLDPFPCSACNVTGKNTSPTGKKERNG